METASATPDRTQMKHEAISEAVDSIDNLVSRIETLRDRINGEGPDKGTGAPSVLPTLSNVLTRTPDSIRNKCDDAHKALGEIEGLLF